jgi:predicted nucleic acid-binding protein
MNTVFIDTWAWIALALSRDQHHPEAQRQHALFVAERRIYVTTDYVLSEVISRLYRKLESKKAERFFEAVRRGIDIGMYRLERITQPRFEEAWQLRRRYADKPGISFVDFTSFAVMNELRIHDVFTGDVHFTQVNMGFQLHPESQ